MNADIFLIGAGQTRFGEWWDKSLRTLMDEAISAAITDAGVTALDIDFVVVANMLGEATCDQAHLGSMAASLLPHRPPALRTEAACASGAVALHAATALLESGRAETVLVVGVEKMTDVPNDLVAAALMGAADAERDAPSGLTFPGVFGLVATRYMHEYGLTREKLNIVSSRHHVNAVSNPNAQFRMAISPEAVGASPLVADPLRLLDCSPVSDGAAALILSTKKESDTRLAASAISTDAVSLTERQTITSFAASRTAAMQAFAEASIGPRDLSHVELHDCFSIAALVSVEDLGLADPGMGIHLYESEDHLTVNASGGLKACGHPVAATGVKQLIDIRKQLRQSKKQWGLAHNFGGAAATAGIHILENLHA
jgi:acetyl-CoA C-acetyltransferase